MLDRKLNTISHSTLWEETRLMFTAIRRIEEVKATSKELSASGVEVLNKAIQTSSQLLQARLSLYTDSTYFEAIKASLSTPQRGRSRLDTQEMLLFDIHVALFGEPGEGAGPATDFE